LIREYRPDVLIKANLHFMFMTITVTMTTTVTTKVTVIVKNMTE